MSVKPTTAITTLYKPFRQKFNSIPFFQKYVPYNKLVESELRLEQNIVVKPITASMEALIGQAIISGIIDEINFYAKVEGSRLAVDGDTYDQAKIVYNTLVDRRKSRFTTRGPSPGSIVVSASTKYKGDFTDTRIKQIADNGEVGTLVFREKRYDVVPQSKYSGKRVPLLVGTELLPTRLIGDKEIKGIDYPSEAIIEYIPVEHIDEFKRNPDGALRDICGIASGAVTPFIPQRHKISHAVDRWVAANRKPWTDKDNYVLANDAYPQIIADNLNVNKQYYVHVDLALSSDRASMAFVSIEDDVVTVGDERLPKFVVDWVFSLKPDNSNQVDFGELRRLITTLKHAHNISIVRVSFDGFNSVDSMQMLRKQGINAFYVSVDRTPQPYNYLRQCLYEDRIDLPNNDLLVEELSKLEYYADANGGKGKVDHTPASSKDLSDAVTGALENARSSGKGRMLAGRIGRSSSRLSNPTRQSAANYRQQVEFKPTAQN